MQYTQTIINVFFVVYTSLEYILIYYKYIKCELTIYEHTITNIFSVKWYTSNICNT